MTALGIIAGAGELPLSIARGAQSAGRAVFLVALEGHAKPEDVADFPHGWASVGEIGKVLRLLRDAGCRDVTFAGHVPRPQFSSLKLDARGALVLPRLLSAAAKGDDALLRALLAIFEKEGLRVVPAADAAVDLPAPSGPLGRVALADEHRKDIALAWQVVRALGAWDVGQGAVVCDGLVLAVEAAEGTDAMLARVAALPESLRGTPEARRGVLVKAVKPGQERRVDLPVIGIRTVDLAAAAGLAGIAVEAGSALIVNRAAVIEAADRLGLFVAGFGADDFPRG